MITEYMNSVKSFQHTLVFDTTNVESYFPECWKSKQTVKHLDLTTYNAFMANNAMVALLRRHELESDSYYLQTLPYIVIRVDSPTESLYFLYQRPGKGAEESRLAQHMSIGIAGYVELTDLVHSDSVIDLEKTLQECAVRKKNEEIMIFSHEDNDDITQECDPVFTGLFLIDRSEAVHRVDIGIVALLILEVENTKALKIACLESGHEALGLFSATELLEMANAPTSQMESWSRELIYSMQSSQSPLHPEYIPKEWTMTMDGNDLDSKLD